MKFLKVLIIAAFLPLLAFASIGKITAINGEVFVISGTKTAKAAAGAMLEQKDVVRSSKGSSAQLVFEDNTVITVGSNTTFKIEEYSADANAPKARFGVAEGSFKAITGKIGKMAPEKFKLETRTATIGIRGTAFIGNVSPNGELKIACTKGAITITSTNPTIPVVVVPAGQMTKADKVSVETPKTFTTTELKELKADLAPLASNVPTKPEQQSETASTKMIQTLVTNAVETKNNDATVAPKWAADYSTYISAKAYKIEGWITEHTRFPDGRSNSYGVSSLMLELANNSISIDGNSFDSVTLGDFKMDAEDSFSFKGSGTNIYSDTYLTTNSDSAGADYVSWGYWQKHYYNTSAGQDRTNFGYWVGGTLTTLGDLTALEIANKVANYSGKVIGTVNDKSYAGSGFTSDIITSSSSVNLRVDFGAAKSITGNMQFSTVDNQTWKVGISNSGSVFYTSSNSFTLYQNGGGSSLTSTTHTLDASSRIDGAFYGPKAGAVAGGFNLVDTTAQKVASGVFKATKQ